MAGQVPPMWTPSGRVRALSEEIIRSANESGFNPLEAQQACLLAALSITAIPEYTRTMKGA